MNHSEALNYLYSLGNEILTAKLGLRNIKVLLRYLGEPHTKYRSILIAGTNGKGSVAAFCDSILRASAYRTGLYTSPHLIQIEERIRIDGQMIAPEEFARLTTEVKDAVDTLMRQPAGGDLELDRHPTYFEMVTAIAFKYFAEQRIEIAVLEVGLGGRLDATNVVDPVVAIITNVDLDHQQYLGNSIREIAAEKAGIIKQQSANKDTSTPPSGPLPVVFGDDDGAALEVIEERCKAVGANLLRLPKDLEYETEPDRLGRFKLLLNSRLGDRLEICLPLAGRHQVSNALTAIRAMELLEGSGYQIDRRSLESGISGAEWPGRLEILDSRPRIILDGAHNPAAVNRVREYIEKFLQPRRIVMVFGAMKDKAIQEMVRVLFPLAREIVLTCPEYERSAKPHEILSFIPQDASSVRSAASVSEAIDIAERLASEDDTIVVVGSLFLVGEARRLLQQRSNKPSVTSLSASLKETTSG